MRMGVLRTDSTALIGSFGPRPALYPPRRKNEAGSFAAALAFLRDLREISATFAVKGFVVLSCYTVTPASTLALDQNGNLYGTTVFGGSTACYLGCGTIFKLAPPSGGGAWTESVLHDLGNSGQTPNSSIVEFHNGLLFGTTTYLGASDVGSVFTLVP
jgi:uncharacterized repeat protein (TIGR03803 family)